MVLSPRSRASCARRPGSTRGAQLPPDEPLAALGLDSLAIVNAVAAVESGLRAASCPRRSGTIAAASRSRAWPLRWTESVCRASSRRRRRHGRPEQPGVSRVERLFLQLEGRGVPGRAVARRAALAASSAPTGRARASPASCSRATSTASCRRSRCRRASRSPPTTARRTRRSPASGRGTQAARMRAHLRRRMERGDHLPRGLGRRAHRRLRPARRDRAPRTSSHRAGTCFGLNLYERREARGRGIGLALLAASLPYTRDARLHAPGDDRARAQPADDRRGDAAASGFVGHRSRRAHASCSAACAGAGSLHGSSARARGSRLNISEISPRDGASVPVAPCAGLPPPPSSPRSPSCSRSSPSARPPTAGCKRALFARNAGTVDGFGATRVPHKGKLLVLPASGKLPASILPSSIGGPRGPAGPPGAAGGDGSSAVVASASGGGRLGAAQTSVETLALKAGSYAIVAKASLHADARHEHARRDLPAARPGPTAIRSTPTSRPARTIPWRSSPPTPSRRPGTVTLTCAADDDGVIASDARIVALRVGSLTAG